jgi:hypothetical protein
MSFPRSGSRSANSSSASEPIVTLQVGGDQLLRVHKDVICSTSTFFQRAMKPEWANQRDDPHILDMSDDLAHIVKDYIAWCYSGEILTVSCKHAVGDKGVAKETFAKEVEKTFITLAEAYVFGGKVIDNVYKNAVLDSLIAFRAKSNWTPGPECAKIIYSGTTSSSPARRLLSDYIAHNAFDDSNEPVGWMTMIGDYPQELLADAMKTMLKVRSNFKRSSYPWMDNPSGYHETKTT